MINKLRILAIVLLLLVAGFLRLYRISATQTFLEDEGRDMLIVQKMIETKLPVLLGPQTSTGNMYLGPLYYYFITPALILAGGNPVGPAVLIALTGVLTVYLLYLIARKWFGESAGWIAATLYAILPYPVMFTRNSWNPNLVPLVMTLLIGVASKINLEKKHGLKYAFIFGLFSGVIMQLHYMALVGVGALGIYIIFKNYKFFASLIRAMGVGLLGMLLTLSPFIAFELRNTFINTKALIGFVTGTTEQNIRYNQTFLGWWDNVYETYSSFLAGQLGLSSFHKEPLAALFAFVFALLIGYSLINFKKLSTQSLQLITTVVVSSLVLGFYQDRIHLHYLGFMLPVVYLFISSTVRLPKARIIVIAMVAALFVYTTGTLIRTLTSSSTNQVKKAEVIASYIAREAKDRPYNVVSDQLTQTSPFQYFLSQQKNRPSNTLQKTLFVICDGNPCSKDQETTTLLYLTGPSHPALANYLAHPQLNEFSNSRVMINNELVDFGIWVAEIEIAKE